MSRIGKNPIAIPENVTVTTEGSQVVVKGPNGELSRAVHPLIAITVSDGEVLVQPKKENRLARSLWGTYASHVQNMIAGSLSSFEKKLVVEGIGYRAELSGNELKLLVGYSHPVLFTVPEGLTVSVEKNVITVSGANKDMVGQFSANVRATRPPEPYKGKGIRYEDEVVQRKQGKRAVT